MRAAAVALALLGAAPAGAGERTMSVTAFDRIRIEVPATVRITTGSPAARLSGDVAALDGVELRQSGTTVTITRRPGGARGSVTLVLTTPTLAAASMSGGGSLSINRMKGSRVDLSLAGSGTMTIDRVDAEQLLVMMVGDGTLTVTGGRARSARVIASGAGALEMAGVEADSLTLRHDGVGATQARARYTADVANTGAGEVTVSGSARCTIRASTGPVACGQSGTATP